MLDKKEKKTISRQTMHKFLALQKRDHLLMEHLIILMHDNSDFFIGVKESVDLFRYRDSEDNQWKVDPDAFYDTNL